MTEAHRQTSKQVKRPSVDPKSYELAQHFLDDCIHSEDDEWELAGEIQRVIEDWFSANVRVSK